MNNFKFFCQKHKTVLLLALGLVLASGAAGYTIIGKIALETQHQQQAGELKTAQAKILAMSKTIGDLQEPKEDPAKSALQFEIDRLKLEIAAFAKQAAACDQIKKRLRIKE